MPRFKAKVGWGRPPVWTGAPAAVTLGSGETYDWSPYASDPDFSPLTFSLVGPPAGYSITSGGLMTAGPETGTLVIRVSDGARTADHTATIGIEVSTLEWTIPDAPYALPDLIAGTADEVELSDFYVKPPGVTEVLTITSDTSGLCSINGTKLVRPANLTAGSSYSVSVSLTESAGGNFTFDPTFSGSGTFADGQTVTITGAGFGTKPGGGKPIAWWDFETGLTYDATHSRGNFALRTTSTYGVLATDQVVTGSTASYRLDHKLNPASNAGIIEGDGPPLSQDCCYIYTKRRWGFDVTATSATAGSIEPYELQAGSAGGYSHAVAFGTNCGSSAYGSTQLTVWGVNVTQYLQSSPVTGIVGNTWFTDEFHYKGSTGIGVQDGFIFHVRDGKRGDFKTQRFITKNAQYPNPMIYAPVIFGMAFNLSGAGWPAQMYAWFDCMYLDDSWCRVMVSDEATWQDLEFFNGAQTYRREIQLPLSWSDTSIQFKIRKGEMASLSGKYLWVVKADNTAVRIGRFT